MRPHIFIGIDPDVDKSGFAYWDTRDPGAFYVDTKRFWELHQYFMDNADKHGVMLVRVEAGWLNAKSNFHHRPGQTKAIGERIAKNVGANHEVGRKIAEMCEHMGIEYQLVRPGKSKVQPEYFEKITRIKTRNQEKIDAGMLVFGC